MNLLKMLFLFIAINTQERKNMVRLIISPILRVRRIPMLERDADIFLIERCSFFIIALSLGKSFSFF